MVYQVYKWEVPKIWRTFFVVSLLLVLMDCANIMGGVRKSISWLLRPAVFWSSQIVGESDRVLRYGKQLTQAARQNLELKRAVEELTVQADQTKILLAENQKLRDQLGLVPKGLAEGDPAWVVAKQNDSLRIYSQRELMKGSVVLSEGRVIGIVAFAMGNIAEVAKVGSRRGGEISVTLANNSLFVGLLTSDSSGLIIEKVPKDLEVKIGDLVVTAGDSAAIAPNIPVSTVSEIVSPAEAVFKMIKLAPQSVVEARQMVFCYGAAL